MTKTNMNTKTNPMKEVEGKMTNDKTRQGQGKAEQMTGKVKDKMSKVIDSAKDKMEDMKQGM